MLVREVRSVAQGRALPMTKKLTDAQRSLMSLARGQVKGPTKRTPAVAVRELSPEERLQEHLEAKRLQRSWDSNKLTASLKGYGGS